MTQELSEENDLLETGKLFQLMGRTTDNDLFLLLGAKAVDNMKKTTELMKSVAGELYTPKQIIEAVQDQTEIGVAYLREYHRNMNLYFATLHP